MFAGVSLDGGALMIDHDANHLLLRRSGSLGGHIFDNPAIRRQPPRRSENAERDDAAVERLGTTVTARRNRLRKTHKAR